MKHLSVNFHETVGAVKPVNGVNNGPLTNNFRQDARPWFKEAAIPFSRLHDTEYPFGSGEFVDVDCLFKNFHADENDPRNYNFTLTDEYLKAICECGAKIIYRLGPSIEHQPVKVHVVPPSDPMKWARICEHIIRHYNEGWADGYHMDIEYWEIWAEPELTSHALWTGTQEEYARFYIQTATYLKEKFPHLKFGGPAASSVWSDFPRKLLTILTENDQRVPLDFFSWHCYTVKPEDVAASARRVDELLKEFGYNDTLSICDEWNYMRDWGKTAESYEVIHNEKGAAYDAAVMCAAQHSPCDILTYYDAQTKFVHSWCGLFDLSRQSFHGQAGIVELRTPYYAFKAFGDLRALGNEVASEIEEGNVYACATAGEQEAAVLLANYHDTECCDEEVRLTFEGDEQRVMRLYRIDRTHNLEEIGTVKSGDTISLPVYSVALLKD